jgi:hypothetical protein
MLIKAILIKRPRQNLLLSSIESPPRRELNEAVTPALPHLDRVPAMQN